MPIQEDIIDHEVIGPAIRQGLAQGRAEGEVRLLLRLAEKRFGEVPAEVLRRIKALDADQLQAAGLGQLDARSLEDLFARYPGAEPLFFSRKWATTHSLPPA